MSEDNSKKTPKLTAPRLLEVTRGIEANGARFEPGEIVPEPELDLFPIEHWLSTGVLREVKDYGNR